MDLPKMKKSFQVVRFSQVSDSQFPSTMYVFAAPVSEIEEIAGIPRKQITEGGEEETIGYQRPAVDRKLPKYLADPRNVIPTSLLLATRDKSLLSFAPAKGQDRCNAQTGTLTITSQVPENASLLELLDRLIEVLRKRISAVPEADTTLVLKAKSALSQPIKSSHIHDGKQLQGSDDEDEDDDDEANDSADDMASAIYSQDAHLERFCIRAVSAATAMRESPQLSRCENVLGFTRDMLLDYLRPTLVVDGQHRLLGALEHRTSSWEKYEANNSELPLRLSSGESLNAIRSQILDENDRWLPVCLLNSDDWSEHVFHFVVVNQKAKSINKALLSSIISTSLTDEELEKVKPRLGSAGILIEEHTIVGRLRTTEGPFCGFVRTGFDAASTDREKLEHTSLIKLFKMFRELKGGKDPNESESDTDAIIEWRKDFLEGYQELDNYKNHPKAKSRLQYWGLVNGPWREVFEYFHQTVKDNLVTDSAKRGSWGNIMESNIFNFVTLQVLQIQFFHFLYDRENYPRTFGEFKLQIDEFIKARMNRDFFIHKWNYTGRRLDKANVNKTHLYIRRLWKDAKGDVKKPKVREFFAE
jgi:hypothetical protein